MSDIIDGFKAMADIDKQDREVARAKAAIEFVTVRDFAKSAGLTLRAHTEAHYSLRGCGYILNIYPGNRRLYYDRSHRKPPFLKLPDEWSLLNVVQAAIEQWRPSK